MEKEVMMMSEVIRKIVHKSGSQQSGKGWQNVVDTLNPIKGFNLSQSAMLFYLEKFLVFVYIKKRVFLESLRHFPFYEQPSMCLSFSV